MINNYKKALEDLLNLGVDNAPNEYDLINELIKRATPKKVTLLSESYYQCNNCEVIHEVEIIDSETKLYKKYCDHCGQTLDWSE